MTQAQHSKQHARLSKLLKDLFQLDQPELDFGLYKIMHAKSVQITHFLENDLLTHIEDAFGARNEANADQLIAQAKAELFQTLGDAALDANGTLSPTFAALPAGKQYLDKIAAAEQAQNALSADAEIFDHLYRFFERYYDNGDFLSKRYYARENDTRAAPYSVPYDGREVYLHWANKDQYYIKSGENFSHYTFDPIEALKKTLQTTSAATAATNIPDLGLDLDLSLPALQASGQPFKVHCRIAQAQEGEHGNIKATSDQKREFTPLLSCPAEINAAGELCLNFEYQVAANGAATGSTLDEAQEKALKALKDQYGFSNKGDAPAHRMAHVFLQAIASLDHPAAQAYARLLASPAPTDKQTKRPLLAKYIALYTARNTMDYFIHKDLGGFLRRELDFYIKNEVMHLDDIDSAQAPKVEHILAKIKVLRRIAHQLIAFLAQLEDFQKKLWLKKKFVTQTDYCITLDRVPESLYPAIAANDAQRQEWVKLFAIDEIKGDMATAAYTAPLTPAFLKANPFLVLDTALFDPDFKASVLDSIHDLDAQCNGVLMHSENFQALGLMQEKYREQVKCVYIDPPFNLGTNGDFLYKTDYKDSTWLTILQNRIEQSFKIIKNNSLYFIRCDHNGNYLVRYLINNLFTNNEGGFQSELLVQRIRKNVTNQGKISLPLANDSLFLAYKSNKSYLVNPYIKLDQTREAYWRRIDDSAGFRNPPERLIFGKIFTPYKIDAHFKYSQDSINEMTSQGRIKLFCKNSKCDYELFTGIWSICPKCGSSDATPKYLVLATDEKILDTNWMDVSGYASTTGFPTENSEVLLNRVIDIGSETNEIVLDYFSGSGTTLISAQKASRKWLGVEMGIQLHQYIIPRLKKLPNNIKKPLFFKYSNLESYEDALNNLVVKPNAAREAALAQSAGLRQSYVLNYWLDIETQGSPSLLNVQAFADPTNYVMNIKQPGSDAQAVQAVDLIETFNWLIGLWVQHLAAPQCFAAEFKREMDADLPADQNTRLVCTRLKGDPQGAHWFRLVEGYTLKVPGDESTRQKTLVVWRKLTADAEQDNAALQTFLMQKLGISPREQTYDVIYINGSHTLPNPLIDGEQTKVRLIEEAFHQAMWSQTDAGAGMSAGQ